MKLLVFFSLIAIALAHNYSLENPAHLIKTLKSYGLLQESQESVSQDELRNALRAFQSRNGLKPTGDLTNETIAYLRKARCGDKDNDEGARARRYKLFDQKFKKEKVNYCVYNYPTQSPTMTRDQVLLAIRDGLNAWEPFLPIKFTYITNCNNADFFFSFGKTAHDNWDVEGKKHAGNCYYGNSFNSQGGVLAHAFFPQNGNLHFDDNEKWTEGTDDGINLRIVTIHEMGHALGLHHSDVEGAIMLPYYGGYIAKNQFRMHHDEIRAVYKLYYNHDVPAPTRGKRSTNSLCQAEKLDAVFDFPGGYTYIVANGKLYRRNEDGIDESFEVPFKKAFRGVPNNIQAAMFSPKHKTLRFISGNTLYYAKFRGSMKNLKFRKLQFKSEEGFTQASAAFASPNDDEIYLVQDKMVYTLKVKGKSASISGPSRSLSDFLDIGAAARTPPSVDGAYVKLGSAGKEVFFFTGLSYYKGVKETNEGKLFIAAQYPKPFFKSYLNC